MRRDSIERTGRLGDFQWRFLSGSLFSKMGWTRGNRPDGSVYSTVEFSQWTSRGGIGDVSPTYRSHCWSPPAVMCPYFPCSICGGEGGKKINTSKWHSVWVKIEGAISQTMKHETRSSIATTAGGSWRVPDAVIWLFSARQLSRHAQATPWQFRSIQMCIVFIGGLVN